MAMLYGADVESFHCIDSQSENKTEILVACKADLEFGTEFLFWVPFKSVFS